MNLKPNQHKRISFNTTIMASLGFIVPLLKFQVPHPNLIFCSGPPPQKKKKLFWSELFRSLPKIRGGCYHDLSTADKIYKHPIELILMERIQSLQELLIVGIKLNISSVICHLKHSVQPKLKVYFLKMHWKILMQKVKGSFQLSKHSIIIFSTIYNQI